MTAWSNDNNILQNFKSYKYCLTKKHFALDFESPTSEEATKTGKWSSPGNVEAEEEEIPVDEDAFENESSSSGFSEHTEKYFYIERCSLCNQNCNYMLFLLLFF